MMYKCLTITDIYAREIIDSRGNPTVETEVLAGDKYVGRASVPSGASTGKFEALELRDGEKRYHGLGVQRAVENVNEQIAENLIGMNIFEQAKLDEMLVKLDGTGNKSRLGANAMLGVSLAAARAAAAALDIPLYAYLGGAEARRLPVPMMNLLNGGVHADSSLDMQEFMILPVGACCFREGLRMCAEIYHTLKQLLRENGFATGVGDEGGFAVRLPGAEAALELLAEAVWKAGYRLKKDIVFAIDAAASGLYDRETKRYRFPEESRMKQQKIERTTEEMILYYEALATQYPIVSIEDALDEEDWEGWKLLTERLGNEIQLVGDDLFVTNTARLRRGIEMQAGNAVLIKPNQIGTLTETIDAIRLAKDAGYRVILSHRSGETEDSSIADIAVAFGVGQMKTGAPCRSERTAKCNQLLRIEEKLGEAAEYGNPFDFLTALDGVGEEKRLENEHRLW